MNTVYVNFIKLSGILGFIACTPQSQSNQKSQNLPTKSEESKEIPLDTSRSGLPVRGHYKKLNSSTYLLTLNAGSEVMSSLQDFQKQTGLKSGSLNGLGVFNNTSLGFYKFNKDGTPGKTHSESLVEGNREVVSFHCNFTTSIFKNATTGVEATAPHCHIALAGTAEEIPEKGTGGFPVVGGHFISGKVGVVAEFVVTSFDTQVTKVPSEAFGGRVIDLGNDLEAAELKNAP